MKIKQIHHAAYRCRDAKETVERYVKYLGEGAKPRQARRHAAWMHAPAATSGDQA